MQFGPVPGLIFPMCSEGSIMKFVETHPEKNRIDLVCYMHQPSDYYSLVAQLFQVASGINYLHEHDFIHADLRGVSLTSFSTPMKLITACSQTFSSETVTRRR